MEPTTKTVRFVAAAALGEPGLILLAVAIVAFIVWLVVGTREPGIGDVLKWVVAGVIGGGVVAYAGSWHEVSIDSATGRITERNGFLGHRLDWMGQQRGFQDFTIVLVERTSSTKTEHNAQSWLYQSLADNPSGKQRYALSLRGPDRQVTVSDRQVTLPGMHITLPMAETGDPRILEASARQLARLGGWTAKRRGYALTPQHGEAADRPRDQLRQAVRGRATDEPGALQGLKRMLGLDRQAALRAKLDPTIIRIIASDAESLIDGDVERR